MIFEKQQYQQDCVDNIICVLRNIDFDNNDFSQLPATLKSLAKQHNYPKNTNNKKQLDVLMETGTGKTFTYLKTIFELNKQFGQTKFVIVLPRTAIKLGVVQNIKLTDSYFFNEYGKHLNYIDHPKDGLQSIQQNFINSDDLSILITTNSAFNSAKNNINKTTEGLFKEGSIWQGIANKDPIVIIDEPHLLKGSETKKGLDKLKNSLFIRFGATYPDAKKDHEHQLANVVYTLDSICAFNQYLVKKIAVSTIFSQSEIGTLSVRNIKAKNSFEVTYNINKQLHNTVVRLSDDLGEKTTLADYKGVSVVKINATKIFLSNGSTLEASQGGYELTETEIKQMIKCSIDAHFVKEQALFGQNIKTLALFFIPKIDGFRGNNPLIKNIFEQEYKIARDEIYQKTDNAEYKKYLDRDYVDGKLQVHQGYFSGDRGTLDEKQSDGVNTILKDKEKLLSFDTPLRFVFSVWALQEGWDNPNIFTICKLSSTDKDTSRRQQVGRGLRVAVNQLGKRLTYQYLSENQNQFYEINTLDMVVSGKEQNFIQSIQQEIMQSSFTIVGDVITLDILKQKELSDIEATALYMGLVNHKIIDKNGKIQSSILDFLTSHPDDFSLIDEARFAEIKQMFSNHHRATVEDKNKIPKTVKIRTQQWQKFKNLWETINKKSNIVYQNIAQQELITLISQHFNQTEINKSTIKTIKEVYDSQQNCIVKISITTEVSQHYFEQQNLSQFITKFANNENLPLSFILALFAELDLQQFYNNPKTAQDLLKSLIQENIHSSILKSVGYQFNQTNIYANELQDKNGKLIEQIASTKIGKFAADETPKDEFLFSAIAHDSTIEKDSILNDPTIINNDTITVFAKLPKINIPTPYKTYNPDFAYLIEKSDGKQLFLVVETKGYKYEGKIPIEERQKIAYGKKFFEALQKQLPELDIKYKTRINGQELSDVLEGVSNANAN